ncbi:MAG: cell division protein FtsH, partial [Candidatus Aminicenantes bacterium]
KIITRNYNRTKELLEKNKDKLLRVAKALLEKEVLDSDELNAIIQGKKLSKSKKAPVEAKADNDKSKKEQKKIQPIKKPDLAKA